MKVLVFGAAGQVGSDCVNALAKAGFAVLALTREQVDFAYPDQVKQRVLDSQASIVVNACAYTAVDKAEQEQDLAYQVNHLSVGLMAEACQQLAIPLIHLSTDYVFDGQSNRPYTEADPVSPLGVYGASKLAGEKAIASAMDQYIILRTSWVFGEQGNNFVKTMLRVGAEREQINVVNDQLGRPSYVGDIVSVIVFFVEQYRRDQQLPWGIYHCSSEGEISWYDFACEIFTQAKQQSVLTKTPQVGPIPSSDYPTPAPRPAYSVLATEKLTELMGSPLPHWREGLQRFMEYQINNTKV